MLQNPYTYLSDILTVSIFYFQYKMPTPEGLRPEIKDNHDGSISVQYTPSIQGRHEVQMCYEGAAIDGKYCEISTTPAKALRL